MTNNHMQLNKKVTKIFLHIKKSVQNWKDSIAGNVLALHEQPSDTLIQSQK